MQLTEEEVLKLLLGLELILVTNENDNIARQLKDKLLEFDRVNIEAKDNAAD